MNGFVIDAPRMKDPQRNDRLDELLEIIEADKGARRADTNTNYFRPAQGRGHRG